MFPEVTVVERRGWFSYVAALDAWFWREWEIEWIPPAIVLFLALSSFGVCVFLVEYKAVVMGLFLWLFLHCYFLTIRDGPGYWPFYWAANVPFTEGSLDGLITNQEQLEWARQRPRPPRSALARSARRFVIRPDHECCYTACWIGKRNHKFFILFNLYGFVYLTWFTLVTGARVIDWLNHADYTARTFIALLYCVLGMNFSMLTGYFCVSSIINMVQGVTEWETYKRILPSAFDRGWLANTEDVCGPSSQLFCWLLPVSPWQGLTNEEISAGYVPYAELSEI